MFLTRVGRGGGLICESNTCARSLAENGRYTKGGALAGYYGIIINSSHKQFGAMQRVEEEHLHVCMHCVANHSIHKIDGNRCSANF